jgi:hypothetical protein
MFEKTVKEKDDKDEKNGGNNEKVLSKIIK